MEIAEATYNSQIETLKQEVKKLQEINQTKNQEIGKLYDNLNDLRSAKDQELIDKQKLIEQLKNKMRENQ